MKEKRPIYRMGKIITPLVSRFLMRGPFPGVLAFLERYLQIVQGKEGSHWTLQGEFRVASSQIHRPGAIVFDVGANKGQWAQGILEAVEYKCQFFLIEPSQHCQNILRSLNLPRTTLIKAAVGDVPGNAMLRSPSPGSERASLHVRNDNLIHDRVSEDSSLRYDAYREMYEEQVKVVTIDEIVEEYAVETIDFMKIDTEGHELAVLHGAKNTFAARRVKALSFEFGACHIRSRTFFLDIWNFLVSYGYATLRICPGGVLFPIEEYHEVLEHFRGTTNYLAVLESASCHSNHAIG